MDLSIFVNYILLATLFGAARNIYRALKTKSYRETFLVSCGKDGGGGSSAPTPPDPAATAAAQGAQDRQTAQTNAVLLNPNVTTPYGQISYDTNSYNVGSDNNTVNRPTQTVTLSPAQQQQLNAKNTISGNLSGGGINLSQWLGNNAVFNPTTPPVPTSVDYSGVNKVPTQSQYAADNTATQQAIYKQGLSLMQPQMDLQKKQLQDQLVNSGNPMGSEGYDTQQSLMQQQQDNALANLASSAVTQGYNTQSMLFNNALAGIGAQTTQAQTPYNTAQQIASNSLGTQQQVMDQNINQLSAILGGTSAIQSPSSPGYNQAGLTSPNIGQYAQQNYQNQLQAYNINSANNNSFNSGLFGIGAAVASPLIKGYFGK